jgi:hypothetical protein
MIFLRSYSNPFDSREASEDWPFCIEAFCEEAFCEEAFCEEAFCDDPF